MTGTLPQLCSDLQQTIRKVSCGCNINTVKNLNEALIKAGANNGTEINIVEIPAQQRFIKVRFNGRKRRFNILTKEEYELAISKKLLPPESWYNDINSKLTLKLKLYDNVKKAKLKLSSHSDTN